MIDTCPSHIHSTPGLESQIQTDVFGVSENASLVHISVPTSVPTSNLEDATTVSLF